jgi:hypothetical protein
LLFASTKENFIFPIQLYLDFSDADSKDFCINAILTKTNKFTKTMIFNSKGVLNGIEKEIY